MKGSILVGGFLAFTAIFAGVLWYYQNYAFYDVSSSEYFTMELTLVGGGEPAPILADEFNLLTSDTSPLKFRACFTVGNSIPMLTETYVVFEDATPLKSPSWFDCYDYVQITEDLKSGKAVAFLGEKNITDGIDRVVAIYDDGRAFAWHQFNDKFAE